MKRPAYFSDITGELIPEGERVEVQVTMDNERMKLDAAQSEIKNLRPPSPKKTARVRLLREGQDAKKAQVFDLPMDEIKKHLPLENLKQGTTAHARSSSAPAQHEDQDARTEAVSQYLLGHKDTVNRLYVAGDNRGFTRTKLAPIIAQATGVGTPSLNAALVALEKDGMVKPVATVRGGGTLYQVVG